MARAISLTERTPEALSGCCVLGILSASLGSGINIQSGPSRTTRGNLPLVPSADSGTGKSESLRHAVAPLLEFERVLIEKWSASVLPGLAAEKDMALARITKLKRDAEKAEDPAVRDRIKRDLEKQKAALAVAEAGMHAPALVVEDTTSERLAGILSENGETISSISGDAGAIVNNILGRYAKGDRTDESIYLKGYSGDHCKVDRQSKPPVVLRSPCLSALWLVQPDKIETLLAERSLTDGGLIPRLLICHSHAEPRPILEDAAGIPSATQSAYRQMIKVLLETYRLSEEPRTIQPEPEALAALNAHFNQIAERRLTDLRDVSTFAARWNEQAWRIAVCLHAGANGRSSHERSLSLKTAQCAIELADWFAVQQLEILGESRRQSQRKLFNKVLELLAETPAGIKANDVSKRRIVQPAEAARTLLELMESKGELVSREEPRPKQGGHTPRIYTRASR